VAGREGREEFAGLEEAEALEHLLGGAVARHHGQDSSAAAAGAAPDVLAEGAGLEGGPIETGSLWLWRRSRGSRFISASAVSTNGRPSPFGVYS